MIASESQNNQHAENSFTRTPSGDRMNEPWHQHQQLKTTLYALGSNGNGQLGIKHYEDVSKPTVCTFQLDGIFYDSIPLHENEEIIKITAGGNHSLLLTNQGYVWVAGSNADGQQGLHPPTEYLQQDSCLVPSAEEHKNARNHEDHAHWVRLPWTGDPSLADADHQLHTAFVTDIAAGWSASFFVVDHTVIFSCGLGSKGELGLGEGITEIDRPKKCFDLHVFEPGLDSSISQIKACVNHVVMLSDSNRLYGWGASRKGQLGEILGSDKTVSEPREIALQASDQTGKRLNQICVGREFTLICETNREHSRFLGDKNKLQINIQEMAMLADVSSVQAGWTSLAMLSEEGEVRILGGSRHSQFNSPINVTEAFVSNVSAFAVGSEHYLAIVRPNTVVAWGWGEHGNCGENVDAKGHVAGQPNILLDSASIVGIAAGCATSFIWTQEALKEVETDHIAVASLGSAPAGG